MSRKIAVLDTTLRDGEQTPGASMNTQEKLIVAQQLLRMGVDVIEAGFPASSPSDFKSVQDVARLAGDRAVVCALARAVDEDIDRAAEALAQAVAMPRSLWVWAATVTFSMPETCSMMPAMRAP